jgi:FG-GAP-like repeat
VKNILLRLAFLALFLGAGAASAQPATAFWYRIAPGTYNSEEIHRYDAPAYSLQLGTSGPGLISLRITGPNISLDLTPPSGQTFATGAYEPAQTYSYNPPRVPTVSFLVNGSSCSEVNNHRFSILELEFDSSFHLASLAVDFEQSCGTNYGRRYGELRFNSSIPLTVDKAPGSIAPDPFAFTPRTMAHPSSTVVSNVTSVYGINASAPISIVGGEYSVNGGAYTSTSGTVANGAHVQVRAQASASPGATISATLTVGGVSGTFNVTTYSPGQVFSGVYFHTTTPNSLDGATVIEGYFPEWDVTATRASDTGMVSMQMRGLAPTTYYPYFQSYTLNVSPMRGGTLAVGPFEAAVGYGGAAPGLSFSSYSSYYYSCYTPTMGRFVVLDADFGPDVGSSSTVNRFAVNFEYWCQSGLPPLYGEIRFNSAVPFSIQKDSPRALPDAFALAAQNPVRPGALVTSNWTTIYGVDADVPVSITGGEFSLNGAAYAASPAIAHDLDDIVVRTRASGTPGATVSATLSAGGRSATFPVKTYRQGEVLTGLYYRSTSGAPGAGKTRLFLNPRDAVANVGYNSAEVRFSIAGFDGSIQTLSIYAPNGSSGLTPGVYEQLATYPSGTAPGLFLSLSDSGSCTSTIGRLVVHDISYDTSSTLQRFAADFELRCTTTGPPLFGEIRYNSAIPLSALLRRTATDLNVDGRSDMLWRNASTGQVYRMMMDGLSIGGGGFAYTEANTDWKIVAEGDFNGDGIADLLWRNDVAHQVYVLFMGANGMPSGGGFVITSLIPEWKIVQTPDIDGDGRADILWWNTVTGDVFVMLMNGATIRRQGYAYTEPNLAWKIVAAADFAGSGKQNQILWRHSTTGQVFLQTVTLGPSTFSQTGQMIYQEPNLAWKILAAADFNGDGRADILWRNETTGQVYMQLMNANTLSNQGLVYTEPNTDWKIVAQGDYNGDGKADLLWRNEATGQVYLMLMNGLSIASEAMIYGEPNLAWKVLGPWEYGH